jgi:hypothetical protein
MTKEYVPAMLEALNTIRDGELVLMEAERLRKHGTSIRAHGYQLKHEAIMENKLTSCSEWGPPGVGKTYPAGKYRFSTTWPKGTGK